MLAMIANGSEVKVLNFPVDVATLETLDGWKLVEVLKSDHILYAEETIECEDDEQVQRIPRSKIPGVATQDLKEFQRFLVRWLEESDGWDEDDAELAASLINKLDDWNEALNTMGYAMKTDVERRDYDELGRHYFGKWAMNDDVGLGLRLESFINYEALGEACEDESDEYGYWCDIYNVWIDTEDCR